MAKVQIVIEDTEDGNISVQIESNPPFDTADESAQNYTMAQQAAVGFLHYMNGEMESQAVDPEEETLEDVNAETRIL